MEGAPRSVLLATRRCPGQASATTAAGSQSGCMAATLIDAADVPERGMREGGERILLAIEKLHIHENVDLITRPPHFYLDPKFLDHLRIDRDPRRTGEGVS